MRLVPDLGRLGLVALVKDHFSTLYKFDSDGSKRISWSDVFVFVVIPLALLLASLCYGVRIRGLEAIIGGVAVITGLLFGLLIHVFSLGVQFRTGGQFRPDGDVAILLEELRANVAYACGVGVVLTTVLAAAAALTKTVADGVNRPTSAIVVMLFAHLALTLFMIIKRVRSAYIALAV